ncbi:MAG TPA: hypothetical protein VF344_09355, partial [Candidatus Limnocylindrales bacterium]
MKTEPTRDSGAETGTETWLADPAPAATIPAPRQRRAWRSTVFAGGVVAVVALVAALVAVYARPSDGSNRPNVPQVALG